jgi:hypothetical protein
VRSSTKSRIELGDALETIFTQLILDPAKRRGGKTKHPALAAVRRAYADAGLTSRVVQGAVLETEHHRERLDFGVANGRVVQIAQAWSFQVADQEDPDTRKVDPNVPPAGSGLRLKEFLDQLTDAYEGRFE